MMIKKRRIELFRAKSLSSKLQDVYKTKHSERKVSPFLTARQLTKYNIYE